MSILSGIVKAIVDSVLGVFLNAWESNKRDATNIDKGSDKVIKEQLKDETERAKSANEIRQEVREMSDEELDNEIMGPRK